MDHQKFLENYIFYGSIYRLRKDKILFSQIKQMILTSNPLTKNDFREPPVHQIFSVVNEYSITIYNYLIKEDLIVPNWSPPLLKACLFQFFDDYFLNSTRTIPLYNINIFICLERFKNHKKLVFYSILKNIQTYYYNVPYIPITENNIRKFLQLCIYYLDDSPTAFLPIKTIPESPSFILNIIVQILNEWKKDEYKKCKTRIEPFKEELMMKV